MIEALKTKRTHLPHVPLVYIREIFRRARHLVMMRVSLSLMAFTWL